MDSLQEKRMKEINKEYDKLRRNEFYVYRGLKHMYRLRGRNFSKKLLRIHGLDVKIQAPLAQLDRASVF